MAELGLGVHVMHFVFVVGHPAHVHFFRNAIEVLRSRGHDVRIVAVKKETTTQLLSLYGLDHSVLGVNIPNPLGKALDLPVKDLRFVRFLHQVEPDVVFSVNSPYAAQACAVTSIPHVAFCDTEIASAILSITRPFSDAIVTPVCFGKDLGRRHIRYAGYKELAYLHPRWFQPDSTVLTRIGATPHERLIVVRFGSWDSSHDLGSERLRHARASRLVQIVRSLEEHGRVLLTSEREVPNELRNVILRLPLDQIHSLLFYASLYFGEGATMASEAGVLGTPWIFLSPSARGYLNDQQHRYGLGYWETRDEDALARADCLMRIPGLKSEWAERRQNLLRNSMDVTEFMVQLAENWDHGLSPPSAIGTPKAKVWGRELGRGPPVIKGEK